MIRRPAIVCLGILAMVLASTLASSIPVAADAVSVEIEPTRGPVGTSVYVRITGLVGDEDVAIAFADEDNIVATAEPDDYGDCTVSFTVGNYPAGTYRVWIDYETNDYYAYFIVEPSVKLNKSSVSVGDNALVSGKGFAAEKPVDIYFDGTRIVPEDIETDENGAFEKISFTIPEASKGNHVISARDSQGNSASDSIVVKQTVTMLPTLGPPGSVVSISGNGFTADSSIVIYFDGEDVNGILSSDNGSFSTTFCIPVCSTGTYKIKVSDGNNLYYQDFTVTAGLIITPVAGGVGVYLTVEGAGFRGGLPITLSYDSEIMQTVNADVQGNFSTTFKVPPGSSGEHKVSASDGATTGSAIFTVESESPMVPALILPENEAKISRRAYFDWGSVSDPSGVTYDLVIASDASFSSVLLTKEDLSDSEYTLGNNERLPPSEVNPYYWRVRAVDLASNASDWSPAGTFYVTSSPFKLLSPSDGAMMSGEIYFDWEKNDEYGDVTYTLVIATDSELSQVLLTRQGLTTSEYTLSTEEKLLSNEGKPYYWRMKTTESSSDISEWSAVRTFYVIGPDPPPAPSVLSPLDGDEVPRDVHFNWFIPEESGQVTYSLEVALDAGFTEIILAKDKLIKSDYILSSDEELSPGMTYYWRVRAVDDVSNASEWSNTESFCVANTMPDWAKYSLAGLGVVFLCFVCFWLGSIKALNISSEE